MKTFVRLIRRYVLAAVGIVLLLLFSGVAVLGWLGSQQYRFCAHLLHCEKRKINVYSSI